MDTCCPTGARQERDSNTRPPRPAAGVSEERGAFEGLLVELSTRFVHLPPEEVDGEITDGLRRLVEFLDVSRATFAEFSERLPVLRVTHSYAAPGVDPYPIPSEVVNTDLPWLTEQWLQGRVVRLERLPDDLPPEAVHELDAVALGQVRSHLSFPVVVGGMACCVLAFGAVDRRRSWPEDLVARLQLIGEVFANAVERRRLDLALRASEERYRLLLETTNVIPWEADAQTWEMLYVGPQAVRILGYPQERWYERGFWEACLHPEDREATIARCWEGSQHYDDFVCDYRMIGAAGQVVWIHDLVSVERVEGRPVKLRGYLVDVSARRRAEEEARQLGRELAHAGRVSMLGQLASSLAHELNQPLCAIISNARVARRLLERDPANPGEARAALQDIARDGERASEIIGRTRALLRKEGTPRAPLDLNEVIREVAALANHELAGRGVAISLQLAPGLPAVSGDRVGLQQVLLNLILNGADAMAEVPLRRRRLVIRTAAARKDQVRVTVRDRGRGIAPEAAANLFEPFFTTKPGGMGMGLAICRSMVQAHGGILEARPNRGAGATFSFTLPGAGQEVNR